jgi:hypothetical protein
VLRPLDDEVGSLETSQVDALGNGELIARVWKGLHKGRYLAKAAKETKMTDFRNVANGEGTGSLLRFET